MCVANVESSDSLSERKLEQEVQEHHDHCGIRGVAIHENKFLATLAMDGRLCVWDFEATKLLVREATTCIPKKDVGEIHGADVFDRSCRPLFFQHFLATPGQLLPLLRTVDTKSSKIEAIDTDDSNVKDKGHVEPIVCMGYIENYVVTSGRDARIILWEFQRDSGWCPVEATSLEVAATDLMVRKGKVHVAVANGNHIVLEFQELQKRLSKNDATSSSTHDKAATGEAANTTTKLKKSINASLAEFEDDEDDDAHMLTKQQTASQKEKPKKTINSSMADFEDDDEDDLAPDTRGETKDTEKSNKKLDSSMAAFDDDDDVDFENSQESSKSAIRVRFVDDEADDEDDSQKALSQDTNAADTEVDSSADLDMPPRNDDTNTGDINDEDDFEDLPTYSSTPVAVVAPQPAFSPSSTPLDLTRRFLCWNHVGSATLLHGGSDRNTVDIHFTDSAYKRPVSFTDNMNFILGALGEDGGIFASDLQEDDDEEEEIQGLDDLAMSERTKQAVKKSHRKRQADARPTGSSIFFYRFETFGKQREKDWYLNLPDGERVLGAACGEGWAAAVTSRRFLRLFTSGGNQAQIVWLCGDPVTLVGRSRFMAVVYHQDTPLPDGTQKLGYTLWDATCFKVISEGSLSCISKGSSLTWLGFSNDCSLMAMDSDGMLSMLVSCGPEGSNWGWSPVLDTVGLRKSVDDQYWPVTIYDGKLVCVPLKGGNTYPDATRRPVTTTLSLRLPLAKSSIPRNTALEELSVRSNMALVQKKIVKEIEIGTESQEFELEYTAMCAQVDKVTLKLLAATIDAEKLERALDLVQRLHLEKSYDLAIRIADSHRKLADLIEDAKERRFAPDEDMDGDDYDEDHSPRATAMDRLGPSRQISPDAGQTSKMKRSIQFSGGLRSKKHMRMA